MASIAGVRAVSSGVSYFMVFTSFFFENESSSPCRSAQDSERPGSRLTYLLPVGVADGRFVAQLAVELQDGTVLVVATELLDGFNRRRQSSEFWRFVFHGFHLLFSGFAALVSQGHKLLTN